MIPVWTLAPALELAPGLTDGPGPDGLTLGRVLVLTHSGTGSGARPSQWFRRTTGGNNEDGKKEEEELWRTVKFSTWG